MREVELKLKLSEQEAQILINNYAGQGRLAKHLYTIYYDTQNEHLRKAGYALRLRQDGNKLIQTLKGGEKVQEGLYERDEWEWEISRNTIEYPLLEAHLGELYPKVHQKLAPVFSTEFIRTQWPVENQYGLVELAIDLGEVRSQYLRDPICELELELKDGDVDALYELLKNLEKQTRRSMAPSDESKALRGYRLYGQLK